VRVIEVHPDRISTRHLVGGGVDLAGYVPPVGNPAYDAHMPLCVIDKKADPARASVPVKNLVFSIRSNGLRRIQMAEPSILQRVRDEIFVEVVPLAVAVLDPSELRP
jgi:hypothetical protein